MASYLTINPSISSPGVPTLYALRNIVAEVLATDKKIKGPQVGNHEIKIVNFSDNTIIFLRDHLP